MTTINSPKTEQGLRNAAQSFIDEEVEQAIDKATQASWGGSGYSIELFPDGTSRLLWNNQIGNLYRSKGIIISLRPLDSEEWDEDPDLRFYDNSINYFWAEFESVLKEYFADQPIRNPLAGVCQMAQCIQLDPKYPDGKAKSYLLPEDLDKIRLKA